MYVFGGEDENVNLLNDLHVLVFEGGEMGDSSDGSSDSIRMTSSGESDSTAHLTQVSPAAQSVAMQCVWSRACMSGEPPPAREGHTMVHNGRSLLIFGGYNGVTSLNDLHTAHI
jgi:hypothetical protein